MTTIIKVTIGLLVSLLLTSCNFQFNQKDVSGSGNVEDRNLSISDNFDGIKASNGWEVILKKGTENSVTASLDANLYDYLDVHVEGSRLIIETLENAHITNASSKKIIVTFSENLQDLKASSAAVINAESVLEGERISLDVSSAGTINTEVAVRSIDTDASSAGTINLKGITQRFEGDASSAGNINAKNLKSEDAQTDASSAGHISIYASKSIHADASSAGNIEYWGDPKEVNAPESTSGGSVVKK